MTRTESHVDYKLLQISSKAFTHNGFIPSRYTCDGDDVSPPLEIGEIPKGTTSLTLIVEDPDAPGGTWLHWLVYNVPPVRRIVEDQVPGDQGLNDFGRISYGGPCPPSGLHRYCFKVYALDDILNLPEGATRDQVEDLMRDHIIGYGELVGVYRKAHTSWMPLGY
jgi:Raf kinase inhibitor-like YbhB/YbcL family protein